MSDSTQDKIWCILRAIQKKKDMHMRRLSQKFEISSHDVQLLRELYFHPGITLIELADLLYLPKSTVSSMINRFVSRKIVDRTIPENNRRTVQLNISAEFLAHPDIVSISEQLRNGPLTNLNDEDAHVIITGLKKLEELL